MQHTPNASPQHVHTCRLSECATLTHVQARMGFKGILMHKPKTLQQNITLCGAPRPACSVFEKTCSRPLLRGAPSSRKRLRISKKKIEKTKRTPFKSLNATVAQINHSQLLGNRRCHTHTHTPTHPPTHTHPLTHSPTHPSFHPHPATTLGPRPGPPASN